MNEQKHHHHLPVSLSKLKALRKPVRNVNKEAAGELTGLDKLALWITDHVGTMGFFLIIFGWTFIWCGYNIIASEIDAFHWKPFDPFPAFVAYLLISNVIQILLMPLIMVGQNVQGKHAELRAESDFETNVKAEREIETVLQHLELQNQMLIALMEKQGIKQDEILAKMSATSDASPA